MGDSAQVSEDLPSSAVETEEVFSESTDAPLPDEVGSTAPPAKEADQEKPEGDEPAEKDKGKKDDDEGDESKSETDEPDKSKSGKDAPRGKRRDPQKRIDRLTRARAEAEREAAYWRGRAEAIEQSRQAAEPQEDPKPKLEDYDSAEDYAEALADWKLEQKAKDGPPASEDQQPGQETEPRSGDTPSRKPTEAEVASYAAAKLKYTDLDDVLFDTSISWTSHMADAVSDMENAAEVLYHLGQDEAEVERISKLAPRAQEREVWKFAEALGQPEGSSEDEGREGEEAGTEFETDGRKPQVSRAGPVPSRVQGRAPSTKSLEDMSDAEYCAYMNAKEAERRRSGG